MNKVFFITHDGSCQIHNSVMVRAFMVLLTTVPLFFIWSSVLVTWDPFSNSGRLQTAVVSTDGGYTSKLLNVKVNVGGTVLKELVVSSQFDWVLTSKDQALEGARSGEYYTIIVLPEGFLQSMFILYADGVASADITPYTNGKENPLSANLTTQGVQGVTARINTTLSRALAGVAVDIAKDVSFYLDTADTQVALDRLSSRLESLCTQLNSGVSTVSSLSTVIGLAMPLATEVKRLTTGVRDSFDEVIGDTFGSRVNSIGETDNPLAAASSGLDDAMSLTAGSIFNLQSRLNSLLGLVDNATQSTVAAVEELQTLLNKQIGGFQKTWDAIEQSLGSDGADLLGKDSIVGRFLVEMDTAIARQQGLPKQPSTIVAGLRRGVPLDSNLRESTHLAMSDAQQAIDAVRSNYENDLQPKIESLCEDLDSAGKNKEVFRSYLEAIQTDLSESSGGMTANMRRSQKILASTVQKIRDGASHLDRACEQITSTRGKVDLDQTATMLGADPKSLARLISSPIAVRRNAVFPVATFGVGMTPLFTVTTLQVGALLAGVFLRTDVSPSVGQHYLDSVAAWKHPDIAAGTDTGTVEPLRSAEPSTRSDEIRPTPVVKSAVKAAVKNPVFTGVQEYLGCCFMLWVIGMAQSTLLMIGLTVFVEIGPAYPFLLVLTGWIISTVFTNIVYTLVMASSNVGRALAVVLLVSQISTAGGAYPLELLSQWFQSISPQLPAMYTVNLMRSAIAGIYTGDFAYNLVIILLFLIPNLVLGLVSRYTIAGRIHDMNKVIEKTGVV